MSHVRSEQLQLTGSAIRYQGGLRSHGGRGRGSNTHLMLQVRKENATLLRLWAQKMRILSDKSSLDEWKSHSGQVFSFVKFVQFSQGNEMLDKCFSRKLLFCPSYSAFIYPLNKSNNVISGKRFSIEA